MGKITFAHIADVHLGAFREPRLREANVEAFLKAMDICAEKRVDFILICGDLFHTSIPDIGVVERAAARLRASIDGGIPVYVIYGSHDFSAAERSMVDVLHSAGVFVKAARATVGDDGRVVLEKIVDARTGAIIAGISGRKLGLDRSYYDNLDASDALLAQGPRIFAFHAAITELKPRELAKMTDTMPASCLPRGFDYYAGGHVHEKMRASIPGWGLVAYPGPLFGDSYRDLENEAPRGFYLVTIEDHEPSVEFVELPSRKTAFIEVEADNRTAADVNRELEKKSASVQADDAIVLIKVRGELSSGKPGDIDTEALRRTLSSTGAYVVYVNKGSLTSREKTSLKIGERTREDTERTLLREHLASFPARTLGGPRGVEKAIVLLRVLGEEHRGGTVGDYEKSMVSAARSVLLDGSGTDAETSPAPEPTDIEEGNGKAPGREIGPAQGHQARGRSRGRQSRLE